MNGEAGSRAATSNERRGALPALGIKAIIGGGNDKTWHNSSHCYRLPSWPGRGGETAAALLLKRLASPGALAGAMSASGRWQSSGSGGALSTLAGNRHIGPSDSAQDNDCEKTGCIYLWAKITDFALSSPSDLASCCRWPSRCGELAQ